MPALGTRWRCPAATRSCPTRDFVYLAGYVVFAIAVLGLLRRRPAGRREALLDGSAFASAAAVVIWIALARPEHGASSWTLEVFERIHPGLTASVGIAIVPRGADVATTLLKNADAAMYRAKRAGGNKTWADLSPASA